MDSFFILEDVAAESDDFGRQPSQVDGAVVLRNAPETAVIMLEENKEQNSSVADVAKTRSQKHSSEINLADQETNSPLFTSGEHELTKIFESNSLGLDVAENNGVTDQRISFSPETDHAKVWHDDPSILKQRKSSDVFLVLFKFSRQYKQLKQEMNSTEKTFEEALTGETSRETSMECFKKFQCERERLEELVEKMLLNCDIEGFHEICREQGLVDSENDMMVLGDCSKGTDSRKCQCSGMLSLSEDNKEFKAEVASLSQKEVYSVQTENNLQGNSQENYSQENYFEKDKAGTKTRQNAATLVRDLDDLQQKHKQITREHNEIKGKVFEVESELCSVEIERDLKNETARYLEEQVASVSSVLIMRENELVSLRKRYKFLNEALKSSEELREHLESETSRMTVVIKELEERLEKAPRGDVSSDIFNEDPSESEGDQFDFTKDVERLEGEISEVLEKERVQENGVEEMLANVEKERKLLLIELDELKDAYRLQRVELEEYKEKRHNDSKKELQKKEHQQQGSKENNEEMLELQETITRLSRRILFLEDENKKLEGEICQQLEVMEKMETENTTSRQERENISSELKKVKLKTVGDLVTGYCALKSENEIQDVMSESVEGQDVKPPGIELDPGFCSTSKVTSCCCMSYSVPKSEYVKLKFQLKSMSDEMRLLKEVTVPEAMKNLSVTAKTIAEERTSLKNENNVVKKWLNTMKESVSVVMEEDEVLSKRFDSVLIETQLHEARINLSELQHELEMIKKDKEILVSQNGEQEKDLNVLKQRMVKDQNRHENTLKELKEKFERLEKELKDERKNHINEKARVVSLKERNAEVGLEFENVKRKLECLEKGKKTVDEELRKIKLDVLKYFGGEHLESVYESRGDTRKKCSEYVKVIENNKNIIFEYQRDLDALTNVNTALRKELNEAKMKKDDKSNSQKYLGDMNPCDDQMQVLETGTKNDHELLGVYMKETMKRKEAEEQMNIVRNELQQVRVLLSEKEHEYETSKVIIQELEATCQVYENEFEKMTNTRGKNGDGLSADGSLWSSDLTSKEITPFSGIVVPEDKNESTTDGSLLSDLTSKETTQLAESMVPRDENESTAGNLRELQEMVQGSLAAKLQVLQRHFGELLEALCTCRKLNVSLQQRLHSVEMKHLENEAKKVHGKRDEDFEKVLKELSEKEKSMEEMLCKKCPECNSDWGAIVKSANCEYLKDTLFHYKKVVIRLRSDKETCEEKLFEAHERIKEHEEKIAMIDYSIREKNTTNNDVEDIRDVREHSCPDESREYAEMETERRDRRYHEFVICEDEKTSLDYSADRVTAGTICFSRRFEGTSRDLKEELDCVTANYINLRAAFEGCQRRLKFLESGTEIGGVMNDEIVVMATETPLDTVVKRTSLGTRNVGDDELSKVAEGRICSTFVKNAEIRRNESIRFPGNGRNSFQKHSGTQTVQNLDDELQSSVSLFSEISLNFSETNNDAGFGTEKDYMVIELTLTETEVDVLESQRSLDEMDKGKFENDYSRRLRNKIQELESIVLSSKNDKVCSIKEKLNFENTVRNIEDVNTLLTTKVGGLEQQKRELRFRVEELEAKLLACDRETERIKICSFREKQVFDNTIKELKDTNHTIKKRIEELEREKRSLNIKMEEVEAKFVECYNETQRVKVCSFNERQTFDDTVKTLQNTLSISKKDVDEHNKMNGLAVFKMKGLEDQVSVRNQEIQRIKVCSFNERKNLENKIKNLEDIKTRRVADSAKQKDDFKAQMETRLKVLEDEISSRDEEIKRIKVCSFSEIQNLEDSVKYLKDTIATMEKQVEDKTKETAQMETRLKVFEDEIVSRDEEIKRIKVCASNERKNLEDTIKTAETMKTAKISDMKKEKDDLESRMREHEAKILSCEEEIHRIKVCAFNSSEERVEGHQREKANIESRMKVLEDRILLCNEERERLKVCSFRERENFEGIIKKLRHDTENNLLHKNQEKESILRLKTQELQQSEEKLKIADTKLITIQREVKTSQEVIENVRLANISLKQDLTGHEVNVFSLKTCMDNLESEKKSLEDQVENMKEEIQNNNGEKRRLRETFEGVRGEYDILKEKVRSCEEETSALRINVANLENDKRNLESIIRKNNEELHINDAEKSNLRENVEENREEIEVWKQNLRMHKEKETVLKKKLEQLENEKENLTEMNEQKQKEIRNLRDEIEKCNEENYLWKQKVHFHDEEVIIKRTKLEHIENEKGNLKRLMSKMDEEKQEEIKYLREANEKCNEESSLWKQKVHFHEEEGSVLRKQLEQLESEKENIESLMSEMDEQKQKEIESLLEANEKCHEESHSWKQKVHSHEQRVVMLRKQLEQLENENENIKRLMSEMDEEKQKEITNLREANEKCNDEINSWKLKLRGCQDDVTILRANLEELENEKQRNEEKEKEKQFFETNIESRRQNLKVLNVDIEEVSVKKVGLEKELRDLNVTVEKEKLSWLEKKEKYQLDISNLKEIMDELMHSKLTLLEEIAQLSDQKKEGQEMVNNETTQLRKLYKELENEYEQIRQEKSKLEFHISSLKITLDTLQRAYEQSQDDNKRNEKQLQERAMKNQEKVKLINENGRLKRQVTTLENTLRNSENKNKELFSCVEGNESQLFVLEKEKETYRNENVVLMERLKQLELPNEENSQNSSSSTQVNNLRKKVKEFRSKLGEEKKQREVCEFEIKNLKEKVERLTKKENEIEEQLDGNRKKFLEMKSERDALRLDLEGVNKRKKRDVEGYTSRIESLVNEMKSFKEKEMKKEEGKELKKTLGIVNEQNKLLEMKLAANAERSSKENQDLQNTLKLLQGRYDSEQERFMNMEMTNQSEILELKKSLSTIEVECEKKARENDKLRDNLSMINKDKERMEKVLEEKISDWKKWKKEAFDAKAEISFLRGALNILEKEGVMKNPGIDDLTTSA